MPDTAAARSARPQIALTFDDGPSEVTNRVLDVLEEAGAKATFFVLGEQVEDHVPELRRMAAGGFQIGNHTWGHEYISRISEEELRSTLTRTNDAIREACGVTPTVMRPPGGFFSYEALDVLADMGFPVLFWGTDPRDWETKDAASTIDYVFHNVVARDVVIMHDVYESTADAVEVIVPELLSIGVELVTIDELAKGCGGLCPGRMYRRFR